LPPLLGIQADVEQVLLNLIGNARDAMQVGGRLSIRGTRQGNWLELVIADTGCGIPAEHLAKIEEPFFTTKSTGNGLGLSICRSIVSQMRGKLQVQSRVGQGTSVTVSLPLAEEGIV
jgi:signal transduction histidine kinase